MLFQGWFFLKLCLLEECSKFRGLCGYVGYVGSICAWVQGYLGSMDQKVTWFEWVSGYIKLSRGSKICGISRMLNLLPNVHAQTLIILLSILQVFMDFRKCIFLKRSKTKYWVKCCRIVSSNCFKNRLASGFSSSTF